jgi:hypothetical protein
MIFLIGPFADTAKAKSKSVALSFEKAMKTCRTGFGGVKGRVRAVHSLLTAERGIVSKKMTLAHHLHYMQVRTTLSWPDFLSHLGEDVPVVFPQGLVFGFEFPALPPPAKHKLVKLK